MSEMNLHDEAERLLDYFELRRLSPHQACAAMAVAIAYCLASSDKAAARDFVVALAETMDDMHRGRTKH